MKMARTQTQRTDSQEHWEMPPNKRTRILNDISDESILDAQQRGILSDSQRGPHAEKHFHEHVNEDSAFISSTSKLAPEHVAPFLAKHIPSQYAPQGGSNTATTFQSTDSNTKFCYRHRPDMLCRRQADEPSMDNLQRNLEALPHEDRQAIVQVWSTFSAAPSKYRNLMLQGILAQCCFPQLSFLSANVRELIRIDFLSALPSEIAFRILCFLDTTSLCKAAQVSRKWRQLADDDVVWHRMCEQHIDRKCNKCGWGLPLLDQKRLRASKRQMQLRAAGRAMNEWSPRVASIAETPTDVADTSTEADNVTLITTKGTPSTKTATKSRIEDKKLDYFRKTRPWKDVYRDRFRVGTNWKYGRCSTKVLKGHANGIMTLQITDNILATGSYDATIKIWDLDSGEELRTLTGHTMGIRSLQFDNTKLISGSMDKTLKVWNWRTGECIATYRGHDEGVIGLHFDSNVLVSGAADCTARVWNFEDKSILTLRGHTDWVNSVRIDTASRTVFTASDDFTIKMWDLDTQKCIRTFEGHVAHVQQVVVLPHEFDAEDDRDLPGDYFSDAASSQSHHTAVSSSFEGHSPILTQRMLPVASSLLESFGHTFGNDRPAPPRYILSSALDNTIRLWEVASGRCIRTFFGHVEGVWALAADTLRIVSGAEDRMVKVWDPRSGKCERTFTGHSGPITCIGLSDSRMCSAGEDGEVRVYCFSDNC